MALFITQCPYCMTSFRTSITQLQSADGMVRCGACLRIFAADDNLVPSAELQTVAMPIQDVDSGQLPLNPAVETATAEEAVLYETLEEAPSEQIFTLDLADSIPNRRDPSISESTSFWELLEETEPAVEQHQHEQPRQDPMPTMRATNIDDDFLGEVLHDVARHHPRENFSAENLAAVHDVVTPLEIDWQPRERSGWSTFLMSVLILLLAAGLPVQYVWYHREELSQNTFLRPWLDLTCVAAGCTLPPLIDIRAISSEDLLVRSHAEIANALSVNLVFRNTAAFAQPFPALELRFTDADNALVAQRRFLPSEYLPAELADMQMMPPDAPVQIQLEILDPGVRAVNYEVSFSPVFSQN
ncbi:MAG: zinc-ribbon and DUF3426 domain-containing protein [Gammaproteobacteria bacterium]|nr:zinc-ribbon and DUF3426 domain-containing protein [Gammaproteobacteria bacterium]